jgi:hypothetical protein
MIRKKPRCLYWYNLHHELEKHKIFESCTLLLVQVEQNKNRWRCRNTYHDYTGWDTLKAAKMEEIGNLKRDIYDLNKLLNKLLLKEES